MASPEEQSNGTMVDRAPTKFEHTPLSSQAGKAIRLLKSAGVSKPSGMMKFELTEHNLEHDCPEYRALSYTWGPEAPLFEIMVNDAIFRVRRNLYQFLQHYSEEEAFIWIDQLSIHQEDTSERNHQVQMMADIYSRASLVIIWPCTGDAGDDAIDQRAMQFLSKREFFWTMTFECLALTPRSDQKWTVGNLPSRKTLLSDSKNLNEQAEKDWAIVCSFTNKPYWQRLWIVQEILLARDAQLWAGGTRLPWTHALRFHDFHRGPHCVKPQVVQDLGMHISDHFQNLCSGSSAWSPVKSRGMPFSDCVNFYMHNECSDPRDVIYGLQGVIDSDQRLTPDYSKSKEEVFVDAVVWIASLGRDVFHPRVLAHSMSVSIEGNWTRILDIALNVVTRGLLPQADNRLTALWLRFVLTDAVLGSNTAFDKYGKRYLELPSNFWAGVKDKLEQSGDMLDSEHYLEACRRCST